MFYVFAFPPRTDKLLDISISISKAHQTVRCASPFLIFLFGSPIGDVKLMILIFVYNIYFTNVKNAQNQYTPSMVKKLIFLLMAHRMTPAHCQSEMSNIFLFYCCRSALPNDGAPLHWRTEGVIR
jgi:hypothetical protein